MKVRHPNAFYLRPYMEPGWDNKIKYITDAGYAKTGLLPLITSKLKEFSIRYRLYDNRLALETPRIAIKVEEFTPRKYQIEATKAILYNKVDNVVFQRGIIDAATNAGKTLIAAMLHLSFKNIKTIILVNNAPLFQQFLEDMPKMFGDDWGYMQGKRIKWGNIMVCMTPTLSNRLNEYSHKLASYQICIFDECHLITSKTNKRVVNALYNTSIRVGLSGTPLLHKDPTKNMDVRSFFGDIVFKISNIELMEMGYSTKIVVKIIEGNKLPGIKGDYPTEYDKCIIYNRARDRVILKRLAYYLRTDTYPILVVCKYHKHVESLHKRVQARFGQRYKISYLHGDVKERYDILNDFKEGKIDILISSMLIKLGQNIPLIKVLINAASGSSQINVLQIVGRLIRKHKTKNKVYLEDFFDEGRYLKKHSKRRIRYYKAEGFKVLELYKKK